MRRSKRDRTRHRERRYQKRNPVDDRTSSEAESSSEGATRFVRIDTRRSSLSCLVPEEKPDIVELDSSDDLTADERAQIAKIKAQALKRRREREATPPPATPAKRAKPEQANIRATDVRELVNEGITAAIAPLLDRLDNTDTNFGAMHRRLASLEYAYPIYSPLCL